MFILDRDRIIKALENAPLVYGYIVNATLFYDEVIKIEPHIFNGCENDKAIHNKIHEAALKLVSKHSKSRPLYFSQYGRLFINCLFLATAFKADHGKEISVQLVSFFIPKC